MSAISAEVQVLAAEVRVLMVGNRQVTLSVYRQLDLLYPQDCDPFGRIRDGQEHRPGVWVVGSCRSTGALIRSVATHPRPDYSEEFQEDYHADLQRYKEWTALPLIVLAGLR